MARNLHVRDEHPRLFDLMTAALIVGLLIIVSLSFKSYGFTSDEQNGYNRAEVIADFLTSFGKATKGISTPDLLNVYGAMPDLIALGLQKLFPALALDSRHLVGALFGIAGIFYVYRLGAAFVGPATGFFAALFLASNPMWFGYMFINLKDIPFAAMLLAAAYYFHCAVTSPREDVGAWFKFAIVTGLLATTKLLGLVVLAFVAIVMLTAWFVMPAIDAVQINRKLTGRLLIASLAATLGCLVGFLIFWPQFYFFSLSDILDVIRLFMNYDRWNGTVLIHGEVFPADKVPRYYILTYFVISMPLVLLALLPIGGALAFVRREPTIAAATTICVAFFSYQAATRAQVYNGYRHFIFLLPFASLVAAYPVTTILDSNAARLVKRAVLVFVTAGCAISWVSMYQLFPFQYSFYNSLVGGVGGAKNRFYIDVWRSALREALETIESDLSTRDLIRIYSCGSSLNLVGHPRLLSVASQAESDYIVALPRGCPAEMFKGLAVVGEVRRQGAAFAVIYLNAAGRS